MILRMLRVENFKAWRELDVEFGKVTGLFGANSSGKSSVLQFLLMLKQTKSATDQRVVLDFGGGDELVDLGNYGAIVHGGDANADIEWILRWQTPDPKVSRRTHAQVGLFRGQPVTKYLAYGGPVRFYDGLRRSASSHQFRRVERRETVNATIQPTGRRSEFANWKVSISGSTTNRTQTFVSESGPTKTHLFPSDKRFDRRDERPFDNNRILRLFESDYEALCDSIFYLGPLRDPPQRHYWSSGAGAGDVGIRGERTVVAILAATDRREPINGTEVPFQELIAHWLREMRLIDSFVVREVADGSNLFQVLVRTDAEAPEIPLTDVGFGISQILPVVVLLHYVPRGSVVLMEQPELHLHPSAQSGLADLMLSVANERDVQIVVESHSEYLLRRLQRRVAEGTASDGDIKLYFVRKDHGVAVHDVLKLNRWGYIENWPTDFFGDEMGEIAATSEAGLRRRMREARSE